MAAVGLHGTKPDEKAYNGRRIERSYQVLSTRGSIQYDEKPMKVEDQEILSRIKRLGPSQKAEVIDFIDFVSERRGRHGPLVRFLYKKAEGKKDLSDLRRSLAKIQGTMSSTVRALRDERG